MLRYVGAEELRAFDNIRAGQPWVQSPAKARASSILNSIHIDCYPLHTLCPFPGHKAAKA